MRTAATAQFGRVLRDNGLVLHQTDQSKAELRNIGRPHVPYLREKVQLVSDTPLISAIVPVYNCQDVLHRCVESVLAQTYTDFELILVDDGSTDASPQLCDSYAHNDKRVRVIHRQNGGTSAARNTGIDAARGAYLVFLDNDDEWVSEHSLEHVARRLQQTNPDVLVFLSKQLWENTGMLEGKTIDSSSHPDNPDYPLVPGDVDASLANLVDEYVFGAAVWSKAIKRSLVEREHIRFPEGMRNEDSDFSFCLLRDLETVDYLNEPVYIWHRGRGVTQSSGLPSRSSALDLAKLIERRAAEINTNNEGRQRALKKYLSIFYSVWLGYSYLYQDAEVKGLRRTLGRFTELLNESGRRDVRLIGTSCRLLGQGITGRLLAFRYRLKAWRGQ